MEPETRNDLIFFYFLSGCNYNEILDFLAIKHQIFVSKRQLSRVLKKHCLYRKKYFTSTEICISFIRAELRKSSQLHGYRWMHLKCIQNGLIISREMVRKIIKNLDPDGVEIRSRRRLRRRQYFSKGPNFIWHMDSYDKLKPYGICINGAVDGFSRHIIWLKASKNTSDPKITAGFFLETVERLGGCPKRIRSDMGTENSLIEQIQIFLRRHPVDRSDNYGGQASFLYGTSQANQRIESWWSILRKHCSQFWMNIFGELKCEGHFTGTFLDKAIVQFCFMDIIQDELTTVAEEWNSHLISKSRNSISKTGRPIVMYECPQRYGVEDCLCPLDQNDFEICVEEATFSTLKCDEDVFDLCNILMTENKLTLGNDPYKLLDLYITLRGLILNSLN